MTFVVKMEASQKPYNITSMGKKQPKKHLPKLEEDNPCDEEEDEEMSGNSKEQKEGGRGRQDNSLSVLTKKFIDLIKSSDNSTIDLNVAV